MASLAGRSWDELPLYGFKGPCELKMFVGGPVKSFIVARFTGVSRSPVDGCCRGGNEPLGDCLVLPILREPLLNSGAISPA